MMSRHVNPLNAPPRYINVNVAEMAVIGYFYVHIMAAECSHVIMSSDMRQQAAMSYYTHVCHAPRRHARSATPRDGFTPGATISQASLLRYARR